MSSDYSVAAVENSYFEKKLQLQFPIILPLAEVEDMLAKEIIWMSWVFNKERWWNWKELGKKEKYNITLGRNMANYRVSVKSGGKS